ncbi:serine/threonine-protein kinase unc-51-like [Liolophura sinensis]|uniref:serine/threonine-protein kinase unc-51-like n=1 Tax=Liolophura sinensis TaxID=3198878 RepID=UPI0031583840
MEVVGDYEYSKKDLIGHGAFAVVFKGRHRKRPDHTVAIKSITKKNLAKSQNLLSKEIKILKELSDLHHENVVALLDCKETANHVYLVMEYCNGGDLADYLQGGQGTLSEDTISIFLRQIAGAMKALNAKGVVHRDLKPQNILLCHSGKANAPPQEIQLKIADFGFARFLNDGVMAATLCGSPMYMAPEVIMSLQYDAKADLWSIGTIVFQCLTGKAPFQAQTPQQLKQFYERNAELVPNIPAGTSSELRDLLLNLLKRNAKNRIDFDHFFTHKFLQPASPAASSSPVPVPNRSQSFGSDNSSPSLKQVSASPLSDATNRFTDKVGVTREDTAHDRPTRSPSLTPKAAKVGGAGEKRLAGRGESRYVDFVMVPEGLPSDQSMTSDKGSRTQGDDFGSGDRECMSLKTVNVDGDTVTFRKPHSPPQPQEMSPNRPSTLPVQSPNNSPTSEPIPVPTQVKAYRLINAESPSSPRGRAMTADSPKRDEAKGLSRDGSESKLSSGPDIGSLSPPNVQFTIGTPPSSQWRRNSVGTPPQARLGSCTPPSVTGSPLKKSGNTPPRSSPLPFAGPGSLPTILGSPTKMPAGFEFPLITDNAPPEPVHAPFGCYRPRTMPDNMATVAYTSHDSTSGNANTGMVYTASPPTSRSRALVGRSQTEPGPLLSNVTGTSRMAEQLFRTAFAGNSNMPQGTVARYSGSPRSRERSSSLGWDRGPIALDQERSSTFFRRGSAYVESSPPGSFLYAQSPPNMEGPITFVAPELQEETLMDEYHNEVLAKLSFVLDLVECIIELAQTRGTPINTFSETIGQRQTEATETLPRFNEAQRRLEQLVLYMRSLHLLSSSLQLAKDEIKSHKLHPSNSLKAVAREMNNHYHRCLAMCRQLHRLGFTSHSSFSPQLIAITADKLIYNYAIELCQTAALDELFGNPQECFRRYRTAQILLHSLSQQAKNVRDKELLNKYREAVEKRLFNIQGQGNMNPYDAYS